MFLSLLLSSFFTFVELNCENLFDTVHDSLKNDTEFLPESDYHWTRTRYWKKINHLSQEIIALGELVTPYYIYNGSLSQSKKISCKVRDAKINGICRIWWLSVK